MCLYEEGEQLWGMERKLAMLGRLLQKEGMATEGTQEVGHVGKVADIGKGAVRKFFPTETKSYIVSHVVCLGLIFLNTCCTPHRMN